MDYYRLNSELYGLLSKVVHETQIITAKEIPISKVSSYPRLKESKYVISKDVTRVTSSIVTAHDLNEYRPSRLRIEKLIRESNKLAIDVLIECIGGVKCV